MWNHPILGRPSLLGPNLNLAAETMPKPDSQNKPEFLVISPLPAPYREPIFQRIHDEGKISIRVIYQVRARGGTAWGLKSTGLEMQFDYPREYCRDSGEGFKHSLSAFRYVWQTLRDERPGLVLIHGYSYPASWAAIIRCFLRGLPYGLRSDSNVHIDSGNGLKKFVKRQFLRRLVKGASAIFYIGTANRRYWQKYGASDEQLREARYAVDDQFFVSSATKNSQSDFLKLLYVGRLIPRKNVKALLHGFRRAVERHKDLRLTIVGSGPDELEIKEQIKDQGLAEFVNFEGRKMPAELPSIYQSHDLLICPYEHEPWGLTINEAMSCGLPVIAATNGTCGAAVDLVQDGVNGIGLSSVTETSLFEALSKVAEHKSQLGEWGHNSLSIISAWRFDSPVSAFTNATLDFAAEPVD